MRFLSAVFPFGGLINQMAAAHQTRSTARKQQHGSLYSAGIDVKNGSGLDLFYKMIISERTAPFEVCAHSFFRPVQKFPFNLFPACFQS